MVDFTDKEVEYLKSQEISRVATISEKGWPQTTPLLFVFDKGYIYFSTDYESKRVQNIKKNNKVSIVMDTFARQPQAITIQGTASVVESDEDYASVAKVMSERHAYYKSNPLVKSKIAIVKITPITKLSWGING